MSAGNLFTTKESAFGLRRKVVNSTYTVRVGGDDDNFQVDRVVAIIDPAAAFTITVPDGSYVGQEILVTYVSGTTHTVTVDTDTGSNYSLSTTGDFCSLEWVNATVGWIYLAELTT